MLLRNRSEALSGLLDNHLGEIRVGPPIGNNDLMIDGPLQRFPNRVPLLDGFDEAKGKLPTWGGGGVSF